MLSPAQVDERIGWPHLESIVWPVPSLSFIQATRTHNDLREQIFSGLRTPRVENMHVDHGRIDVAMAQQFLNGTAESILRRPFGGVKGPTIRSNGLPMSV